MIKKPINEPDKEPKKRRSEEVKDVECIRRYSHAKRWRNEIICVFKGWHNEKGTKEDSKIRKPLVTYMTDIQKSTKKS